MGPLQWLENFGSYCREAQNGQRKFVTLAHNLVCMGPCTPKMLNDERVKPFIEDMSNTTDDYANKVWYSVVIHMMLVQSGTLSKVRRVFRDDRVSEQIAASGYREALLDHFLVRP